jgi:small subunit ribosomal protein S8
MSYNYILGDSLARIRNAQSSKLKEVELNFSKFLLDCLFVLKKEGYICDFYVKEIRPGLNKIFVLLKYYNNSAVISKLELFSKPGRRVYCKAKDIKKYFGGLGLFVLSTSKGIITSFQAVKINCGGELLFGVY